MTKREFYEKIKADYVEGEVYEMACHEIELMDARNARRASSPSKKAVANEPIKAEIVNVLTTEAVTASEIAEKVGITTQKASALLRQIDGLAVTEIKVKGKGKVKGYALAE